MVEYNMKRMKTIISSFGLIFQNNRTLKVRNDVIKGARYYK